MLRHCPQHFANSISITISEEIIAAAVLTDNQFVIGCKDKYYIWDWKQSIINNYPIQLFVTLSPLVSLTVGNNNDIFIGFESGSMLLIDAITNRNLKYLTICHKKNPIHAATTYKDKVIVASGGTRLHFLGNQFLHPCDHALQLNGHCSCSLTSIDFGCIAIGYNNGYVRTFDLSEHEFLPETPVFNARTPVTALAYNPDLQILACGSKSKLFEKTALKILDLIHHNISTLPNTQINSVSALASSKDMLLIATGKQITLVPWVSLSN